MRIFIVALLLCLPALADTPQGCADRSQTKLYKNVDATEEEPPQGRAVLVFISTGSDLVRTSITIDGQLVAITGLQQYSIVSVEPGDHKVCAFNVHWSDHQGSTVPAIESFSVEAGKTYYVEQSFTSVGIMKSSGGDRLYLRIIAKDQADALLKRMKPVKMIRKG